MISVLLYGRNDNHGYNLHKRAAISINCIAEMLDHPDDEILFADYNTPNDLPSFIEAIQDTLTRKARDRLRVLRIRPAIHRRFEGKTQLVALESISRNAAIRRSNPRNRWILSTNTDMIFVPREQGRSLSTIVGALADGFYHLPRFDLPECLWESFDRLDPAGIIAELRDWGVRFHLNDVVYGDEAILYDGPGDFQLALRDDVFAIHGFHEEMLLGWHVDSNFAKRMRLHRGALNSALPFLYGYHCDHTRQATALHSHSRQRVVNDPEKFVYAVDRPEIAEQQHEWGLAGEEIEEMRLSETASTSYLRALEKLLPPGHEPYSESYYNARSWNDLNYDPHHVLPYLCDLFSTVPRGWSISYAGCRNDSFALFCRALAEMGFVGRVAVPDAFAWLDPPSSQAERVDRVPVDRWIRSAQEFVFEFGLGSRDGSAGGASRREPDERRLEATSKIYRMLVEHERDFAPEDAPPRRVVAVNVIHNSYESMVGDTLSYTYTPYSTRTRHGYVVRRPGKTDSNPKRLRTLREWLRHRGRRPAG